MLLNVINNKMVLNDGTHSQICDAKWTWYKTSTSTIQ